MATIGSLAVNIVATTDKFIGGINKARSKLGTFVKGMGVATAAAASFAVAGLGAIVKQAIEAGGALQDLASKLNISTEALTALQYAASQMGVENSALEKGLSMLVRRIGEAGQGFQEALFPFQRLGLNFKELIGMRVEDQFLAVVDALKQVTGAEERAAIANDLFGRSWQELNNFIKGGSEEIQNYGQRAAELGLVLSQDVANGLDEASDTLATFAKQWEMFKLNMVGEYAPEIQTALDFLVGAMSKLKQTMALMSGTLIAAMEGVAKYYAFITGNENMKHIADSLEISRKRMDDIAMGNNTATNPLAGNSGGGSSGGGGQAAVVDAIERQNALLLAQERREILRLQQAAWRGDPAAKIAIAGLQGEVR